MYVHIVREKIHRHRYTFYGRIHVQLSLVRSRIKSFSLPITITIHCAFINAVVSMYIYYYNTIIVQLYDI